MQFELIHCSTEVLDAGNIKVEGKQKAVQGRFGQDYVTADNAINGASAEDYLQFSKKRFRALKTITVILSGS
ncbi:hypothetical protein PC118_g22360 [Phytophthora cactorum]|uniref:Uncharacterized protein n=1 Tax=Phytophthora cactorum TaxID=29920 RepID=A0A8T1ESG8_9STRA|nr:hypothetical protein PC118_g22360 [Phytophthora cactorum]